MHFLNALTAEIELHEVFGCFWNSNYFHELTLNAIVFMLPNLFSGKLFIFAQRCAKSHQNDFFEYITESLGNKKLQIE